MPKLRCASVRAMLPRPASTLRAHSAGAASRRLRRMREGAAVVRLPTAMAQDWSQTSLGQAIGIFFCDVIPPGQHLAPFLCGEIRLVSTHLFGVVASFRHSAELG